MSVDDVRVDDGDESGFTLIELMVAMVLFGILASIGTVGFRTVQASLQARGAHRESVTQLRTVQARAVAENTAYCVDFGAATGNSWNVYRVPGGDQGALSAGFTCTSGTKVATYTAPGKTSFSAVSFQQRNGSFTSYGLFYARGAASGGSFKIGGGGASVYTVTVDSLTGRVASSGA